MKLSSHSVPESEHSQTLNEMPACNETPERSQVSPSQPEPHPFGEPQRVLGSQNLLPAGVSPNDAHLLHLPFSNSPYNFTNTNWDAYGTNSTNNFTFPTPSLNQGNSSTPAPPTDIPTNLNPCYDTMQPGSIQFQVAGAALAVGGTLFPLPQSSNGLAVSTDLSTNVPTNGSLSAQAQLPPFAGGIMLLLVAPVPENTAISSGALGQETTPPTSQLQTPQYMVSDNLASRSTAGNNSDVMFHPGNIPSYTTPTTPVPFQALAGSCSNDSSKSGSHMSTPRRHTSSYGWSRSQSLGCKMTPNKRQAKILLKKLQQANILVHYAVQCKQQQGIVHTRKNGKSNANTDEEQMAKDAAGLPGGMLSKAQLAVAPAMRKSLGFQFLTTCPWPLASQFSNVINSALEYALLLNMITLLGPWSQTVILRV
jgi:hypothetical protein